MNIEKKLCELENQGKFVEANKLREAKAEEYSPFKDEMSEFTRLLKEFVKERDNDLLHPEFSEINQGFKDYLEDTFRGSEEKEDIKLYGFLEKAHHNWLTGISKAEKILIKVNKDFLKEIESLLK